MKVFVKATEDITRHVGLVQLEAKEGDVLELNSSHAEVALATGSFVLVDEVPATAEDKAEEKADDTGAKPKRK